MCPALPTMLLSGFLMAGAGLLTTLPAQAQQPADAQRSLPPIPGLGPAPVLPTNATPAEKEAYARQMAERTRQR